MQYWKSGDIYDVQCPRCKRSVEFFKDDTARRCPACGHRFVNPAMDFGCAAYCPFAEQCLGNLPEEAVAQREDLLKDRVAVAMKRYYRNDFRRIGHTMRRARFAERIGKAEQANLAVVLIASYLGDLPGAESQAILEQLGAKPNLRTAIAAVLARTAPTGQPDAGGEVEWRILDDAERLTLLEERLKVQPPAPIDRDDLAKQPFRTASGGREAAALLSA